MMFTGIIEDVGRITSLSEHCLTIASGKIARDVNLGDSISVNGICLTVTKFDRESFVVDVMEETLERTTLRYLRAGDLVNLERALTLKKRLGGHLVQGHVDDVGEIKDISRRPESTVLRITASPRVMRYVVEKGFIAVDGISLTVVACDARSFAVSIVNFTWDNTRLSLLTTGDLVNLEADIFAKYVEQFVAKEKNQLSIEFLQEHGFASR